MQIHDRPYVNIKADKEARLIELRWTDHCPSKEYREALETALEAVKEHDLKYWFADLRNMAAILHDDEKWTNEDWFPRLAEAGLERMAILTSTDFFNQVSVDRIMDNAEPIIGFQVAYFDDEEKAFKWLKEKQPLAKAVG